ncbi:MAG: AraC family transcriptional regulator [Armatimonadetes bacterium]|nr:AraC family transcriptional regulator [Chloroflexota bacterium]MBL1153242.1 AraC family transcriptional regulator [Armatimonadota bacterium]NOG39899.1 AraC family transcriptional regulator [Armatimonadota bacterium]NOG66471.1 AraC family transcriptional regulator [Chloroflexota bacterium]
MPASEPAAQIASIDPSHEQARFWRVSSVTEVELLYAKYVHFSFDKHYHEEYALGVVETGIHAFWYRGGFHTGSPGQIVTYQPGEIHNGQAGSDEIWRYRMFYISADYIRQLCDDHHLPAGTTPFLNQTIIEDATTAYWLRRLHQEFEAQSLTLERQVLLNYILTDFLLRYSDTTLPIPAKTHEAKSIQQVIAYIHAHFLEDITLDELAQVAHLSKSYLIRAFRNLVGLSPYSYLVQVRLNQARLLLRQGHPISQVAQDTGFADQSHFTRYFRRALGVTPGQYLQKS